MVTSKNALELLAQDPVELSVITLKTRLMLIVTKLIKESGYTQCEAAEKLGVTQPRISNLMNGKISKFSIDMLIEMLGRMGYLMDVSFDLSSKESPISISVKKSAV